MFSLQFSLGGLLFDNIQSAFQLFKGVLTVISLYYLHLVEGLCLQS